MILSHITPEFDISGSVVIVGSSAKLLKSKHGANIDSFDNVLRFNRAPTEGFEEHVGSKTTMRIVNGHVFTSRRFTRWKEDDTFVKKLRNTKLILARDTYLARRRNKFCDPSIELYTVSGRLNTSLYLTVGLMGIILIVLSGIRPVVYGWSTTIDEPMSHYFNKRSPLNNPSHKWDQEIMIINQLMLDNKILMER
ncbi:glycosyltransferase family 29 protein [Candidatus Pacearchaeota archaeon]|nr:glycosyltransferase family 29 protein [Candidatus Pacearchaeota archaeon]